MRTIAWVACVFVLAAVGMYWSGILGTGGQRAGLRPPEFKAGTVLVPGGTHWRYFAADTPPPAAWSGVDFDDSRWLTGSTPIGFGRERLATELPGPAKKDAPPATVYLRTQFTVDASASFRKLHLYLLRDDGAVVYVNGKEAFRSNMPAGVIAPDTPPVWNVGGSAQNRYFRGMLDPGLLVAGSNVLAVEVHQTEKGKDDMGFDLELVGSTNQAYITRGPYLQLATQNGITIRWRTDSPTTATVRYGRDPRRLNQTVGGVGLEAEAATEHEVRISGLEPETRYDYSVVVGDVLLRGGDAQHSFKTAPPIGEARRTRVWVIGDSGLAIEDTRDVRDAYHRHLGGSRPDVWLMLGDNAYYHGTDDQYQAAVFQTFPRVLSSVPLWPTLGNHDGYSADSNTQTGVYYDVFTLPTRGEAGGLASGTEAYYSFEHGDVHFICLDSHETDRSVGGAMLRWLKADLADTTARWIIAYWHHPPYSKGSHDSDTEQRLVEMRENALPILEAGGVDLILSGHSHSYERSFLLDGHYGESETLRAEMIKDKGSGRPDTDGAYEKRLRTPHEGAVYIVAGSSSHTTAGELDHPAMFLSLLRLGSLALDIDGPTLKAEFLDEKGQRLDHFTLLKH